MRITFLTRSLNSGGAERQLTVLATGLHERGHRVLVLPFYSGGPLQTELAQAGVPVRSPEKGGRWDLAGFARRLAKLLRRERPDVLHGYLGGPNVLTVLLKPLLPRTRIVWGVRAAVLDLARYDRFSRFTLHAERLLSRFADRIVVNSRTGRSFAIERGFPKDKVVAVLNGIDTDRFRPDPASRSRIRKEWGVAGHEKLVGLVARLIPIKDHPNFLRAAALLAHEREDVRFVCVGDGRLAYRDELRSMSRKLGLEDRLVWAGARSDAPAVFNALDVAVSSSYGEGFPNVVGEAMACGTPCVVTDVGDSADIVGGTGVIVPPRDSEALARGIAAALSSTGMSEQQEQRERIVHKFSVRNLISTTEDILMDVVKV